MLPARRRAALGPVARHAERGDDARPVEDRAPGRDRRRVRVDRLLPLERRVHDSASTPSSPSRRPGIWNRLEYRPLEGFVFAVSPFNFTAIGANLTSSPALMGNTVVWKPASHRDALRVLRDAPLPGGRSARRRDQPRLRLRRRRSATPRSRAPTSPASTSPARPPVFNGMWRTVAGNMENYRNYPRIVGETGGKDFIVAHPSADVDALAAAIVRGSFEYQGQKCSAASRVYAPSNLWPALQRAPAGGGRDDQGRRRHRLRQLHGRGDRRRRRSTTQAAAIEEAKATRRERTSSSAAATTTRTATSSTRP